MSHDLHAELAVRLTEADALRADRDRLREENERLTAALERIVDWSDAYPTSVFIEPSPADWRRIAALLKAHGFTLDAVAASSMRRVVNGVGGIARAALAPVDPHREEDRCG
jgi:transposase